jgi:hypothetical protein
MYNVLITIRPKCVINTRGVCISLEGPRIQEPYSRSPCDTRQHCLSPRTSREQAPATAKGFYVTGVHSPISNQPSQSPGMGSQIVGVKRERTQDNGLPTGNNERHPKRQDAADGKYSHLRAGLSEIS